MRTTDWRGVVCSPGVRSQNGGGAKRVTREGGGKEGDTETITRSDIPRRTMRCNSLYPVEGEPPPILATKRRRLNSHDRSHYLLPRSLWRCGRSAPTRIIFTDSDASIAVAVFDCYAFVHIYIFFFRDESQDHKTISFSQNNVRCNEGN